MTLTRKYMKVSKDKMTNEEAVVYVTKYALTEGILQKVGVICHDVSSDMFRWSSLGTCHKGDWWRTKEEAVKKAEEMKRKKILSLKKQIQKLENLKFE
jgi:hypothetical protein